jgi:ABC-type uncharacterized transport system permease subunit
MDPSIWILIIFMGSALTALYWAFSGVLARKTWVKVIITTLMLTGTISIYLLSQ